MRPISLPWHSVRLGHCAWYLCLGHWPPLDLHWWGSYREGSRIPNALPSAVQSVSLAYSFYPGEPHKEGEPGQQPQQELGVIFHVSDEERHWGRWCEEKWPFREVGVTFSSFAQGWSGIHLGDLDLPSMQYIFLSFGPFGPFEPLLCCSNLMVDVYQYHIKGCLEVQVSYPFLVNPIVLLSPYH